MKILTQIIRFIVAVTFIFSGFVKMIDPVGTKIKMLEYFSEDVLNLTFFSPYALEISILLIWLEFVLGVWLLLGYKIRFTLRALLVLVSVFLFLTWYSAYYNKVTDCGCFGDAVKLSNWETFYKNVILIVFIWFLNRRWRDIRPLFSRRKLTALSHTFALLALLLMIYTVRHLPLIDFRPYAVGKNIEEGMKIPPGAPKGKFKDIWYYRVNGEVKEFTNEDEPWNIKGAEFVDRKTIVLQEAYTPPIHDFSIENETGEDITEQVLKMPEVYLVISYDPAGMSEEAVKKVNEYTGKLQKEGHKVIGMFALVDENLTQKFNFPLYMTDATTLKTMIRSNPGVIKLEYGTVVEKKAWRDL